MDFKYHLINLREIDCELFINSSRPEEIILGILANFKGQNSASVIQGILKNLKRQVRNPRSLHRYLTQLEILAELRNLQPLTIQQIDIMPITYDITKDLRFQQGIEQGIEQGATLKTRKIVEKMLSTGKYSLREIAEIAEVSIDFVIQTQQALLSNDSKRKKR